MGTRADFYIGRGVGAEWLGSIAWDGYPSGITPALKRAKTEEDFRTEFAAFLQYREDATLPSDGWPWPWDDSQTTDYAYAFDAGRVYASCFGGAWFNPSRKEPDHPRGKTARFPNMRPDKAKPFSAPAGSKRSGIMLIGPSGPTGDA